MTLAVSVGDPAGVGPIIAVDAAAALCPSYQLALFGDADWLARRLSDRGVEVDRIDPSEAMEVRPGVVGVVHVGQWSDAIIGSHRATAEGGAAQLAALDAAIAAARDGRARAVVTGPTSKAAVVASGQSFTGQTEHLARAAGLAPDDVTMMFLGPRLRVALVTTHVSIREAPDAITESRVHRTIVHLVQALGVLGLAGTVEVTGLNPHAGEAGLFGTEETAIIEPAVARAQSISVVAEGRLRVIGPVPAETTFRRAAANECVGVVTMIHDQATIPSKLLDFGRAVNVTWGLPFVRTSVDHGVAYDAAAAGTADARGLIAAIELAARL